MSDLAVSLLLCIIVSWAAQALVTPGYGLVNSYISVRPNRRHHLSKHLQRQRQAPLPPREPSVDGYQFPLHRLVSIREGVLCYQEQDKRQEVECYDS
jgi:hypothetical protein